MSDTVHWGTTSETQCGKPPYTTNISCQFVTCVDCLHTDPLNPHARNRLTDLRQLQDSFNHVITSANTTPWTELGVPVNDVTPPSPDPHSALLLRAASFLADLPSGSLDRVRNVEAMNLIRALRDAVVPADKPKLRSTSKVKVT